MKLLKIVKLATLSATIFFANIPAYAVPVNVNTASADEIAENLKGIGIKKAHAVVSYRDKNGHYNDLDSLTLVKGIGDKTVEKNKMDILF